jgi:hypothetical protein
MLGDLLKRVRRLLKGQRSHAYYPDTAAVG